MFLILELDTNLYKVMCLVITHVWVSEQFIT